MTVSSSMMSIKLGDDDIMTKMSYMACLDHTYHGAWIESWKRCYHEIST